MKELDRTIEASLCGVYDGIFSGYKCLIKDYTEEEVHAYHRGFERGVAFLPLLPKEEDSE